MVVCTNFEPPTVGIRHRQANTQAFISTKDYGKVSLNELSLNLVPVLCAARRRHLASKRKSLRETPIRRYFGRPPAGFLCQLAMEDLTPAPYFCQRSAVSLPLFDSAGVFLRGVNTEPFSGHSLHLRKPRIMASRERIGILP